LLTCIDISAVELVHALMY